MRTSLVLEESTYRDAKAAAAQMGTSVSSLMERALREYLDRLEAPRRELRPLPVFPGGPRAGIDVTRTSHLLHELEVEEMLAERANLADREERG